MYEYFSAEYSVSLYYLFRAKFYDVKFDKLVEFNARVFFKFITANNIRHFLRLSNPLLASIIFIYSSYSSLICPRPTYIYRTVRSYDTKQNVA